MLQMLTILSGPLAAHNMELAGYLKCNVAVQMRPFKAETETMLLVLAEPWPQMQSAIHRAASLRLQRRVMPFGGSGSGIEDVVGRVSVCAPATKSLTLEEFRPSRPCTVP